MFVYPPPQLGFTCNLHVQVAPLITLCIERAFEVPIEIDLGLGLT